MSYRAISFDPSCVPLSSLLYNPWLTVSELDGRTLYWVPWLWSFLCFASTSRSSLAINGGRGDPRWILPPPFLIRLLMGKLKLLKPILKKVEVTHQLFQNFFNLLVYARSDSLYYTFLELNDFLWNRLLPIRTSMVREQILEIAVYTFRVQITQRHPQLLSFPPTSTRTKQQNSLRHSIQTFIYTPTRPVAVHPFMSSVPSRIIYGTAWYVVFHAYCCGFFWAWEMPRRKKELTVRLVVSAVLKGFRAIDTGKAIFVFLNCWNQAGSVEMRMT
jgi:hypothetical protein